MDEFIQDVIREAGDIVLKRFGIDGVHHMKSEHPGDVVTEADLRADLFITNKIKEHYPSHGIISEESGVVNEGAEYVWVVDPIDGTQNFARHVPMFGVMMCLVRGGEVVLSAVSIPTMKELFFSWLFDVLVSLLTVSCDAHGEECAVRVTQTLASSNLAGRRELHTLSDGQPLVLRGMSRRV